MMDRFEMVTSNSEQIVNGVVDTEKSLDLCSLVYWWETSARLFSYLPVRWVTDGKIFSVGRRIASKLVGDEL